MNQNDVIEHLARRRDYCRGLLELSRRQRDFISAGNYDELLLVVSRKQRLLERLDALKRQQPEVIANWNQRRGELSAELRNGCEILLREIGDALREVLDEEEHCTDQLTVRRDETRRQLSEISSGRKANSGYDNPKNEATHRFLDVNH